MLQRIWDYKLESWRDEDVLADGEMLRVPLMLCDSAQRDVRDHFARDAGDETSRRTSVNDRLAAHNATAGHRPGRVLDALIHAAQPTVSVTDASDDLVARRGMALADAMLERQKALAETEQRQQWRTTLDARRMKVEPEGDDDDDADDEPNGELVGSAEYGPDGDHEYEPEDNDEDDDDVFKAPREYKQRGQYGSQEYGHSGGAPNASGLRAPEDDRERARLERDQRGNNAWRNGPSVSRANTIEQQLERWRGIK
jgi:hypothetical protein